MTYLTSWVPRARLAGGAIPAVVGFLLAGSDGWLRAAVGVESPPTSLAAKGIEILPLQPRTGGAGTLFEEITPERSGVTFQMHWENLEQNLREIMRMNLAGGICTGDIDGDGLPDFYVTSPAGGGRLYRNLGEFRFEDATVAAGISTDFWGTGASMADINNDGFLDLFVCCYRQPNKLYLNDGKGHFTDRAAAMKLDYNGGSMTMAWADTDNDGDLDSYLATTGTPPPPGVQFRVNMVKRASDGKEVPVVVPALEEFWQLLILPNDRAMRIDSAQHDHVFRNDGATFADVTNESGVKGPYFTLSAVAWDYDADNHADWYVSNDFTGPDRLFHNRGDGRFEDRLLQAIPHTPWFSMGSDIGDVNNDGMIDLFATDMSATTHYREKVMMGNMDDMAWFLDWAEPRQFMRNALYLNTGTGRMLQASQMMGVSSTDWTWTPRLEDFDNDGWIDLFITNGIMRDAMNSDMTAYADKVLKPGTPEFAAFWKEQPMRKEKNAAFRNTGHLKFEKVGDSWGLDREGVTFGAATADFDNDGDLDLVMSNADVPVGIYRNRSIDGHAVKVRLVGTTSNKWGLGATVRVRLPDGQRLTRYVTTTRGYLSSSDPVAHFGVGAQQKIAELTVDWPSGLRQTFADLPVDRLFRVTEGGTTKLTPPAPAVPLFTRSDALRGFPHKESPFDDFQREPLLPNKQSRQGPGLAWGDIDGDGDDDLFLGGARGQPGRLVLNLGGGTFALKPTPAFEADLESEDMGAVFFDADGDGDLDLFVVSGGNECDAGDPSLQDRLYLNDGKGGFLAAPAGTIPAETDSGSAVAAADLDQDGDLDLFVGGRAVPGQYPLAAPSHLLINDGGKFTSVPMDCGLVNSALWVNLDDQGPPELVLACEWGSLRVYAAAGPGLKEVTARTGLDKFSGWWNGLAAVDVDHDGDLDLVATNLGLNTKYKANAAHPEMLYFGSFDDSGKSQIVEAKFEGDVLLPRRGLSCSSKAMPFIREKLKTFHNFASATLEEVYPADKLRSARKLEVNTLESGVFLNTKGVFTFKPLDRLAQIAPAFGLAAGDFDGDGHPDLVLAQNFFHPQRETGRMNGGMGLFLKGDGKGDFRPVWPRESGIVEPGDARGLAVADVNGDGAPDVVIALNDAPPSVWLNRRGSFIGVRVEGPKGNPSALGARVTVVPEGTAPSSLEASAGGSYLSQNARTLFFGAAGKRAKISVRWPDGKTTEGEASPGATLRMAAP